MSSPSNIKNTEVQQANRLGREAPASLNEPLESATKAARRADEESWGKALQSATIAPNASELFRTLLAERDLSSKLAQAALFESAKTLMKRRDTQTLLVLLPCIQPQTTPYNRELIELAMTHSSPEEGWFEALKPRATQQDLDGALFFIGQNGLIRGAQLAWAQAVIDAGADPWFMKSVALGSAIGWDNWELADFLAPLSDPRRVAQLIDRAPDDQMPAARAFLEKIELQKSVTAPEPSQRSRPRV